jgi:hypothetical protein
MNVASTCTNSIRAFLFIMFRIKREKQDNYTIVPNEIVRNPKISLKTKGLYMTIMSLPENWDFTVQGMKAILKENETAIYTAIKELMEHGYCIRRFLYENGKRSGIEYLFFEYQNLENLNLENLNLENLNLGNQAQLSTYYNKELKNTNKELNKINNISISENENFVFPDDLDSIPLKTEKKEKEKNLAPKKEKESYLTFEYLDKQNIKMVQVEFDKLVAEYGSAITHASIKYLSDYKQEKNYPTKSDYLTIRRWVIDAVKKKMIEPISQNPRHDKPQFNSKIEQALHVNEEVKRALREERELKNNNYGNS